MSWKLESNVPFGGVTAVGEVSEAHPLFSFFNADLDVDEFFDVYGSDAIVRDPQDNQHNYWVDTNTCAVEDWDEAEELERMLSEEPDDPPAGEEAKAADEIAALVAKFAKVEKREQKLRISKPVLLGKGQPAACCSSWAQNVHYYVQKKATKVVRPRHVDGNKIFKDDAAFFAMPKNLQARLTAMAR